MSRDYTISYASEIGNRYNNNWNRIRTIRPIIPIIIYIKREEKKEEFGRSRNIKLCVFSTYF
jgi:hypothetical protein